MDIGAYERKDQAGKDFIREYFERYLPVDILDISSESGEEKYGVDQLVLFDHSPLCYIDPEVREGIVWGDSKQFPFRSLRIMARKKKYDDSKEFDIPIFHATISPNYKALILTHSENLKEKYLKPCMTNRGEDMGYEIPSICSFHLETDDTSRLYEWFGRIINERYRTYLY